MDQSETGDKLKIKVLNCSKKELLRDLQRAPEFDQSALFKKVYEEEYGIFGGAPFGALIGDYEFGKHPEDIELLEKISQVASAAHAPFCTAASPDLFNLPKATPAWMRRAIWPRSSTPPSTPSGRASARARIRATWPVTCRTPDAPALRQGHQAGGSFNYEEHVDGTDHNKYLWGNAASRWARRMTNRFRKYGWCGHARRGRRRLVEGLPVHNFTTDDGDVAMKCPTEVPITDRREKELADLGFVPLVHCKGTDYAAFFSVQSARSQEVRHRFGQRQCAPFDAIALHSGGLALRPLPESHDARQDRQLHVRTDANRS
jgi:type VI secretion system protein ImpC